jgi:hypothetical protein
MDTPEPDPPGSWLQRRGVDLAVWGVVILAMVAISAVVALNLADARFEFREIIRPFEQSRNAEPPATTHPSPLPVERQPAVPGTSTPTWVVRPAPMFPERALQMGQSEGAVRMTCRAEVTGRFSQCRIDSEIPSGHGFGEGAIARTRQALVTPKTVDGTAIPSEISFTVRFRLES